MHRQHRIVGRPVWPDREAVAVPTTAVPTTVVPTTAVPTIAIPTTVIPTTGQRAYA